MNPGLLADCLVVGFVAVLVSGCCRRPADDEDVPPIPLPGTGRPAVTLTAPEATTTQPVIASPPPMANLPQIPASCAEPVVLLATAPPTVPAGYKFPWTSQTLLALQETGHVSTLHYSTWEAHVRDHRAVLAKCNSPSVCNALAAHYKTIIPSSTPQPVCGFSRSGITDAARARDLDLSAPDESDTIAKCARINACLRLTRPNTTGDPGLECQRAPSKFKLSCAAPWPRCSQVVSCMGM
jgi:hypothetical protein